MIDLSNYELLLPLRGDNNGTDFPDFSPANRTVTRTGVITSTAQSNGYGSSGYWNGGSTTKLDPGFLLPTTGDWTAGAWVYLNAITAENTILGISDGGATNGRMGLRLTGTYHSADPAERGKINWYVGGTGGFQRTAGPSYLTGWHHYEWSRQSGVNRMFVDGVKVDEFTNAVALQARGFTIGNYGNFAGYALNGYMQDFYVASVCLHTEDFTPPVHYFAPISGITRDKNGTPASRKVVAIPRNTPTALFGTESDAVTGAYEIEVHPGEYTVVCFHDPADDPLRNDLIARVIVE